MQSILKCCRFGAAILAATVMLAGASPSFVALAQTTAPTSAALSATTIKALQEALSKQGIAVKADGVLNDETRAAIRKYQSQHHLPITGEPDKATLDKLGVATASPTQAQTTPPQPTPPAAAPPAVTQGQAQTQPGPAPGGMMMNCPMMQGQMDGMMKMMQGMMQMMQMMQGQMQSGPMQPGQMQPPAPKQ